MYVHPPQLCHTDHHTHTHTHIHTHTYTGIIHHTYMRAYIHTYLATQLQHRIHSCAIQVTIHMHIHTYSGIIHHTYIRTYIHTSPRSFRTESTVVPYRSPYIHTYIHILHIHIYSGIIHHTYMRTYIPRHAASELSLQLCRTGHHLLQKSLGIVPVCMYMCMYVRMQVTIYFRNL